MEGLDTGTQSRPEDVPPPAGQSSGAAQPPAVGAESHAAADRAAPHLRSTRGGSGHAAGATPKKAHRPSASSRPRPAGKKPDSGPR